MTPTYTFSAVLWEHSGESPWVFATVPATESDEIADLVPRGPGFGSVRVVVTIGASVWSTSLFPSKELGAYVLPVKRAVRNREDLDIGDRASISLRIETE